MPRLISIFTLSLFLAFLPFSAFALNVETPLANDVQENSAKSLFHEIRCMVCISESIADSPAEVAKDMRRDIRARVANGESVEEIKANLAAEYGDVILMNPPLKNSTFLLWFGPWIVLIIGAFAVFLQFRKGKVKL